MNLQPRDTVRSEALVGVALCAGIIVLCLGIAVYAAAWMPLP